MSVLNKLAEFVGKYLTYIVFAVVVAAFFFPQGFTWAASQTVLLLSVIMFGMGMTLRASDFALVLSRPKEVFFGCVGQFTIMPFLAYVLTVGFELPPELAIGMILLGTHPGRYGFQRNDVSCQRRRNLVCLPYYRNYFACTAAYPVFNLDAGRPVG